jgi:hypothetical protein
MLLLIIVFVLLFGGGIGYYGYGPQGGGISVFGLLLVILLIALLTGWRPKW